MIKAACLLLALAYILRAPAQTSPHLFSAPRAIGPLVPPLPPPQPPQPLSQTPPLLPTTPLPTPQTSPAPPAELTLQVEVRDPDNNPIPGACISVADTRLLVVTDQWGSGTCIAPPGTTHLTLVVTAIGYHMQKRIVNLLLNAGAPLRITLYAPGTTPFDVRIIPCETPDDAAPASAAGTPGPGAYKSRWW